MSQHLILVPLLVFEAIGDRVEAAFDGSTEMVAILSLLFAVFGTVTAKKPFDHNSETRFCTIHIFL